jgi:ubiquinone/menaquinone biosynthesis C-methylase UbiE
MESAQFSGQTPVSTSAEPAQHAQVRQVYQVIAEEYDERIPGSGPVDELFTDTEFDFILHNVCASDHVLDMGCGTGRFTVPLAKRAAAVTGLDISSQMLSVNQEKLSRCGLQATLREGDMTALPFPDASFDVVVSMLALMHIPVQDRQVVFHEAARVLKPGGRLLIGVKNAVFERLFSGDRFATVDVTDVDAGELIFTETKTGEEFTAPWHSFAPDDLARLTALAGLHLVHLRGNNPLSAWLADAVLQDDGLRGTIQRVENALSDVPPFSHLGYHLLAEAVKPA